jgi:hypothetical protein
MLNKTSRKSFQRYTSITSLKPENNIKKRQILKIKKPNKNRKWRKNQNFSLRYYRAI